MIAAPFFLCKVWISISLLFRRISLFWHQLKECFHLWLQVLLRCGYLFLRIQQKFGRFDRLLLIVDRSYVLWHRLDWMTPNLAFKQWMRRIPLSWLILISPPTLFTCSSTSTTTLLLKLLNSEHLWIEITHMIFQSGISFALTWRDSTIGKINSHWRMIIRVTIFDVVIYLCFVQILRICCCFCIF